MGLELEQKARTRPISSEPVALEDLAAEVLKLAAIAERMERTLGAEPNGAKPATGLCACVAELQATVGLAPNAATGTTGSGLCGVVADLALAHTTQSRKMVAGATLAAGGTIGIIELVVRILQAIGG